MEEILVATLHWKDSMDDLRNRAQSVMTTPANADGSMTARTAAACLSGIVSLVSRRFGVDVMQWTCAELARGSDVWTEHGLVIQPGYDGRVAEPLQLIAVVARSLLPLAGAENLRAALAFWASETDPAIWQAVAA